MPRGDLSRRALALDHRTLGLIKLAMARTAAWSLLLGAWLALGVLGRVHVPQLAAGLAPMALWLLTMGLVLAFIRTPRGRDAWRVTSARLRSGLALGALATIIGAIGLHSGVAQSLMWPLLAVGWAILLLHASWVVRALREGVRSEQTHFRLPPPYGPALLAAGIVLALCEWAVHSAPSPAVTASGAPMGAGLWVALVAAASLGLVLVVPRGVVRRPCVGGLFDCSLALGGGGNFKASSNLPLRVVGHTMMPMMATLAWMGDWCSSPQLTWTQTLGLHLLAMLGPPWLLHAAQQGRHFDASASVWRVIPPMIVTCLMAWSVWPLWVHGAEGVGRAGLMAAALAQSLAWGVAWLHRPHHGAESRPANMNRSGRIREVFTSVMPAGGLVLMGLALDALGPPALAAVMTLLAAAVCVGALAWACAAVLRWSQSASAHRSSIASL